MNFIENEIDYNEALLLYQAFQPSSLIGETLPPEKATNQDFFDNFPGNLIQKPQYTNCRFYESRFDSANGAYSKLHCCGLYDCLLTNCDLRYSDFVQCEFNNCNGETQINSCNFSFSNFINNTFQSVKFSGTSFRQMLIADCRFIDSAIVNSSFEETIFNNCTFKNINFKEVGVRFCEFSNCTFENVIFPILDLASNIGLIDLMIEQQKEIKISLGTNGTTNLEHAIQLLYKLIPYYYKTHQYFQIINILLINKEYDKIWELLTEAFNYVITINDFPALLGLCNLIVKLHIFEKDKLGLLYNRIVETIKPEKLPYHLLKSYLVYIKNIQNLLLENPSQYPTAQIILRTNIEENNRAQLIHIIDDIESITKTVDTNVNPIIQLTHHSPYEIVAFICAELPTLLQVCQVFYYTFGGLKSLNDLGQSRHEKTTNKNRIDKTKNKDTKHNLNVSVNVGGLNINIHKETIEHVKTSEYFIA